MLKTQLNTTNRRHDSSFQGASILAAPQKQIMNGCVQKTYFTSFTRPVRRRIFRAVIFVLILCLTLELLKSGNSLHENSHAHMYEFGTSHAVLLHPKPALGICITGQLCRLELSNKISNLVKPSSEHFAIHLVIAVYTTCKFTNGIAFTGEFGDSEATVRRMLKNFSHVGSYLKHSTLAILKEPLETTHARYIESLDKKQTLNNTERARNHYRHWHNYRICDDLLDQSSVYMRIREDSIFFDKFSPWELSSVPSKVPLKENSVAVPSCLSWRGGINDKAAIVYPSARKDFFNGPLLAYENHFHSRACTFSKTAADCDWIFKIANPETYLLQTMEFYGLHVHRLSANEFPVATAYTRKGLPHGLCFENSTKHLGEGLECLPTNSTSELVRRVRKGSLFCPASMLTT